LPLSLPPLLDHLSWVHFFRHFFSVSGPSFFSAFKPATPVLFASGVHGAGGNTAYPFLNCPSLIPISALYLSRQQSFRSTLLLSLFLPTDPHPTAYPGFLLHLTCPCPSLFDTRPTRLIPPPPPSPCFFPSTLLLSLPIYVVSRVGFRFRASLPILGTSWRSALQNQVNPFFSLVFFRVSAVSYYAGPETGREIISTPVKSQPQPTASKGKCAVLEYAYKSVLMSISASALIHSTYMSIDPHAYEAVVEGSTTVSHT
jgi:hypothetical protein